METLVAGCRSAKAALFVDDSDTFEVSPSQVHRLNRSRVREILELAERSGVSLISSTLAGVSLTSILDAFDNEFQLAQLLSAPVSVIFNGHQRTACPAPNEPERYLALVCAEALLQADNSRTRGRIKAMLRL